MRLTSLEIKGFKSFADRTVIHFNDNITGIVGPNGCGKSNIVDAIRWVLGEQKTKNLRSEKMENVIFNGTNQRKQATMAEVSLIFDNHKAVLPVEYSTVSISRTLYRDGTSEYKLNNVHCRLKDITSLFIDTGIGSDSYAIIELGMVDEILTDRDNSRMQLLEQAAGVSKYKVRKRETLLKLNATDADLERVQDVVFEIEGQLKTLEKQAKRAEKYYEIKNEYKQQSVQLANYRLKDIHIEFENNAKGLNEINDVIDKNKTEVALIEANIEKRKLDIVEQEKYVSTHQKQLSELINQIRTKENEKEILKQKLQFETQKVNENQRQLLKCNDDIAKLTDDVKLNTERKEIEQKQLETIRQNVDKFNANLQLAKQQFQGLQGELDNLLKQQNQDEKSVYELEKSIAIANTKIENIKIEIEKDSQEEAKNKEELITLEQEYAKIESKKKQHEEEIEQLKQKEQAQQQAIAENQQWQQTKRNELQDINRKIDQTENEYKLTKNLVENLEGFPESVRFLKKQAQWNVEAPLLTDIIYCDEKYRITIENYLSNYLNYYVVNTTQQAFEGVEILSKAGQGRANFFILNNIHHHTEKNTNIPNAISALEVVETDEKYKSLLQYLLQNVYIVADETITINEQNDSAVILANNGKYTQSKFVISGGSVGLFEGKKIGRKKNLEKLQENLAQYKQAQSVVKQALYDLEMTAKKIAEINYRIAITQAQQAMSVVNNQYIALKTKIENVHIYFDKNLTKRQANNALIEKLESENTEAKQAYELRKNSLHLLKSKLAEIELKHSNHQGLLTNATNTYNDENITLLRQQNTLQNIQQEITYKQRQLDQTLKTKEELDTQIELLQKQIEEHTKKITEYEQGLLSFYQQKQTQEQDVNIFEENYFKSKESLHIQEDELKKVNKIRQDFETRLSKLKDIQNELKLKRSSIAERLSVEFNIQIEELNQADLNESISIEHIENEIRKLRTKLDNYGEINPMAMEAYNEIKQRYDFILSQRKDLQDAKQSLVETMNEIETQATEQLLTAYQAVRTSFIQVFRSLFTTDDKCDIVLTNPEKPLESGLEITAQPKGKRPQTINQLSGGEKTLTAIALLFSLYLLKPAPFCIFDEVDAPLDDTNIGKFNRIITEFSNNSQFILVTHNKQTMTVAKSIYGVTMAQQGISRVVPVDFTSLN